MGRKKIEHRQLTPSEQERAHWLMEDYVWLAEDVALKCRGKYALTPDIALSVAYLGLCEGATRYVELNHDLPLYQQKCYLARSIENALKMYVRKEKQIHKAKKQAERGNGAKSTVPQRTLSLERETREIELPYGIVEVNEGPPPPLSDRLRAFARTLPAQERVVFERGIQAGENGQTLTSEEQAEALGICRSHFYEIRKSIAEKLLAWVDEEFAA